MLAKWPRYSIWIDRFLATVFGIVVAVGSFLSIGYVIVQIVDMMARGWDSGGFLLTVSLFAIPTLLIIALVIGIIGGVYIYPKLRSWN